MTRANARPRATEAPALTEGDVPGLVRALSSSDALAQQSALMGLTRVVPFEATRPALPLAQALAADAPDAEVRCQALSFLGGFAQEPGVLALLEKTLTASDVSVALAAVRALPAVPMALPAVRGALRHPDVEIRRNAAAALGRFAAASAELLEAFAAALKDPARTVRSAAAQGAAVSAKGQATLGPVLRDVLKVEREGLVRALLVRALLETGGVTLADAGVFVGLLAADPERSVRSGSAQLLGRMRAPTAVTALIEALEHDPDALVRRRPPSTPNGCPASPVRSGTPTR